MLAFFPGMAACPPDPAGAADFAEAIKGHQAQNIAAAAGVRPSMVTKWLQGGNIPDGRLDLMPDDVQARFEARRARRRGVIVLERAAIDAVLELFGFRIVPVKASLESQSRGSLSGGRERTVA
jgi:hypothetical protein